MMLFAPAKQGIPKGQVNSIKARKNLARNSAVRPNRRSLSSASFRMLPATSGRAGKNAGQGAVKKKTAAGKKSLEEEAGGVRRAGQSSRKPAGFTLIELMITVAILGIIAAVSIPAVIAYQKRSNAAEAVTNIGAISKGAHAYFETHADLPADAGWTPVKNKCSEQKFDIKEYMGDFISDETWGALGWRPSRDFLYAYKFSCEVEGAGGSEAPAGESYGLGTEVKSQATGDQDGDNTFALFTKTDEVMPGGSGNILVSKGITREDPLE